MQIVMKKLADIVPYSNNTKSTMKRRLKMSRKVSKNMVGFSRLS